LEKLVIIFTAKAAGVYKLSNHFQEGRAAAVKRWQHRGGGSIHARIASIREVDNSISRETSGSSTEIPWLRMVSL
jgi:hypothetical protein